MSDNTWIVVTAVSAAITAIATIIYVIVTRQIACATARQAAVSAKQVEISEQQAALALYQQKSTDAEKLSSIYYAAYDLWRYSALLDDQVGKGLPVGASPDVVAFLPLFQAFMAQKMPVIKALVSGAEEEVAGLWYVDNMVNQARGSGHWNSYADFKSRHGGFFDLFGRLKRTITDEIQKRA